MVMEVSHHHGEARWAKAKEHLWTSLRKSSIWGIRRLGIDRPLSLMSGLAQEMLLNRSLAVKAMTCHCRDHRAISMSRTIALMEHLRVHSRIRCLQPWNSKPSTTISKLMRGVEAEVLSAQSNSMRVWDPKPSSLFRTTCSINRID